MHQIIQSDAQIWGDAPRYVLEISFAASYQPCFLLAVELVISAKSD